MKLVLRPDILSLLESNHIVAFQETWYSKQNLKLINGLHPLFEGIGSAKVDESSGILQGRYSGGVTIMWRKELGKCIRRLELSEDWCVAIEISIGDTKFVLFNVYLPYQCDENEEDYINCLSTLLSYMDDLDNTNFIFIGDWNANIRNSGTTTFKAHLLDFCSENKLLLSSKCLLPNSTYTYIHRRDGNNYYSWLDHIVSSVDCNNSIKNIFVNYDMTDEDHIPVTFSMSVDCLPKLSSNVNKVSSKIKWDGLSDKCIKQYHEHTSKSLSEIEIPLSSVLCSDCNCKSVTHTGELITFFESIKESLINSSLHCHPGNRKYTPRPGWNDYVSELYDFSREARNMWMDQGKPRQGMVHEIFMKSKRRFKCALNYITKNEDKLRRESLAKKLFSLNPNDFWKEISTMNNSRTLLPMSIGNVTGEDEITKLWKSHFESLFNCLSNVQNRFNSYEINNTYNDLKVTPNEIVQAIKRLKDNKSSGEDSIFAEHIKLSSNKLIPLLSIFFTACFVHGYLPSSLLTVILVPIIKNKAGNVNAMDNYRPVALSNIFSKVLEFIILDRIECYLVTNSNQFGFKKKHGTDQCIYALKEAINHYTSLKGCIFACFLDASKAFDRVNHSILFEKLAKRGIPNYILRILSFWYENQKLCVKWGETISEHFNVTNGVRQGSVLSPYFFNVYMDDLSERLNDLNVGCMIGAFIINHILYADDLVLISPSSRGLHRLLGECEIFGSQNDIIFNASKSAIMFFKSRNVPKFKVPEFLLNNSKIPVVDNFKYLGHFLSDSQSDGMDIGRQIKKLFMQGNSLTRKFFMCTLDVKLRLFQTFCSPLYTAHLWVKYTKSEINKLYSAYHSSLKMLLGVSKWERTSPIFVNLNIRTCPAVIRNLVFKFMGRLRDSSNEILSSIYSSSIFYQSTIWNHWRGLLYTNL